MTLPKYALNYRVCKRSELHNFIVARRGPVPIKVRKTEKVYIDALLEMDKKAKFRFMDLPAELRVMIYGHVLAPEPKESAGLPIPTDDAPNLSILRVSKQIHQEAIDVLYKNGAFHIDARFRKRCARHEEHSHSVGTVSLHGIGREDDERLDLTPHDDFYERSTEALKHLPPVRNVEIGLTLFTIGKGLNETMTMAKEFLGAFVASKRDLRKLVIAREWWNVQDETAVDTLRPLRKLPKQCKLELREFKKGTEEAILAMLAGDESEDFDVMQ